MLGEERDYEDPFSVIFSIPCTTLCTDPCSSMGGRDQVPYPYKTKEKYILIYNSFIVNMIKYCHVIGVAIDGVWID
jgi:hypothetical protein